MRRRLVPAFVRTVHHLDQFADPQLAYWHDRAIYEATTLLCVSRLWQDTLRRDFGLDADTVGNGVDYECLRPPRRRGGRHAAPGMRASAPARSCSAVGGFEERKNALRIIEAFALVRAQQPQAQLLVVGGASLLDHASYQARCRAALDGGGPRGRPGPRRDQDRAGASSRDAQPLPDRRRPGVSLAQGGLRAVRAGGDGERHADHRGGSRALHRVPRPRTTPCSSIPRMSGPSRGRWRRCLDPTVAATCRRPARPSPNGFLAQLRRASTWRPTRPARNRKQALVRCLRCVSISAGPTAAARPATRLRW